MKKLMLLAVLGLSLGLTACDKKPEEVIGCAVQKVVTTSVSAVIAQELTCSNKVEIEKALEKELAKLQICQKAEAAEAVVASAKKLVSSEAEERIDLAAKSVFGEAICTPVVDSLMVLVTAQIPTEWGCAPDAKVDALKEKLITKCKEAL